jgi:multidrug resistance efflux pump
VDAVNARSSSRNKTFPSLGAANTWRSIVCVLIAVIAVSAAIARQHIIAGTDDEAAPAGDTYLGMTRPRDVTTVALPGSVVVKQVMVEVGDRVKRGQLLLTLDDEEAARIADQQRFEVQNARNLVAQLETSINLLDRSIQTLAIPASEAAARLAVAQRAVESVPNRQAKDSPERAQATYDLAVLREQRLATLAANGVVSRQELEDAQVTVRVAADDLAVARRAADAAAALAAAQSLQAQTQAELTIAEQRRHRHERAGEVTQARLRRAEAEHALAAALKRLADLSVRSPVDAVVAEVKARPGERMLPAAPLLKLATVDPMLVDVDVPPSAVNALARGDAALIRVGASTASYKGRVKTIAPLPGDAGAHTVEVEFENPTAMLLAGRNARVRFIARSK